MDEFLESTQIIDWRHESILAVARDLTREKSDELSTARRVFAWVRDEVDHSMDFSRSDVTCRASEVLEKRTGFCYAKSHLLAALLRACGISAGFCYQRLSVNDDGTEFCLHGLNAVFLQEYGWYRVDARGNTDSIQAEFSPPQEQLAFAISVEGEADLPGIYAAPLPLVVDALSSAESVQQLAANLPDMEPSISE
jgi:transglutaminase-like putative cysteine protease